MAGGTWTSQNKVRPGAYINFKAVPSTSSNLGTRGVMTMPAALTWGPQKQVIEVFSTDLVDGKSLDKIGCVASDAQSLLIRQALGNCYKAYIYRMDTGGNKATVTVDNIVAVAKYYGTGGNDVSFKIVENLSNSSLYDVVTYFRDTEKYRQTLPKVSNVSDLENNDWIEWSGTGVLPANETVTTKLAGGINGEIGKTVYTATDGYFNTIKHFSWNTMAIPQPDDIVDDTIKTSTVNFIRSLREEEGKKVQAVLHNYTGNYEGIISVRNGYKTNTETIDPNMFTAYIAGLTAGSQVNESNTYKVIDGAISIVYEANATPYDNSQILEMLAKGQLILSSRQDGAIIIEQDINTLHAPYPSADVNYAFSKNRVIRTLDGINNQITTLFENTYIGKIGNTADGRNLFKADIIAYLTALQNVGAIQNFASIEDVNISEGVAIDSVIVDIAVQPVDSIEKLYMTVNVR